MTVASTASRSRTSRTSSGVPWARPAIRLYATYAKWDEKFGTGTSSLADDNQVTFGAQFEAWW